MIVVTSKFGKTFGIDNRNGKIWWELFAPDFHSFFVGGKENFPLFLLRTTAHYPHGAESVAIGREILGATVLIRFNPINGVLLERKVFPERLVQAIQVQNADKTGLHHLLLIFQNGHVAQYPPNSNENQDLAEFPQYTYLLNSKTGFLNGFRLTPTSALEVWRLQLPFDQNSKILAVRPKAASGNLMLVFPTWLRYSPLGWGININFVSKLL